jgi:hypothetical protein
MATMARCSWPRNESCNADPDRTADTEPARAKRSIVTRLQILDDDEAERLGLVSSQHDERIDPQRADYRWHRCQ